MSPARSALSNVPRANLSASPSEGQPTDTNTGTWCCAGSSSFRGLLCSDLGDRRRPAASSLPALGPSGGLGPGRAGAACALAVIEGLARRERTRTWQVVQRMKPASPDFPRPTSALNSGSSRAGRLAVCLAPSVRDAPAASSASQYMCPARQVRATLNVGDHCPSADRHDGCSFSDMAYCQDTCNGNHYEFHQGTERPEVL